MSEQVEQHIESINLKDIEIVHGHAPRGSESAEFNRNVDQLKKDGFGKCLVCGTTDGLQVHHGCAEWSEAELVDFAALKALAERFDVYGYAAKMKDIPMTSVDDIRNLWVVCQEHHTGTNSTINNPTGIHNLVFPFWISQINCKAGMDPVPQEGETLEKAEQRIA